MLHAALKKLLSAQVRQVAVFSTARLTTRRLMIVCNAYRTHHAQEAIFLYETRTRRASTARVSDKDAAVARLPSLIAFSANNSRRCDGPRQGEEPEHHDNGADLQGRGMSDQRTLAMVRTFSLILLAASGLLAIGYGLLAKEIRNRRGKTFTPRWRGFWRVYFVALGGGVVHLALRELCRLS
jgi:hypothetical protein